MSEENTVGRCHPIK